MKAVPKRKKQVKVRNPVLDISENSIRRLGYACGIESLRRPVYDDVRNEMRDVISKVVKATELVMRFTHTKTMQQKHILTACEILQLPVLAVDLIDATAVPIDSYKANVKRETKIKHKIKHYSKHTDKLFFAQLPLERVIRSEMTGDSRIAKAAILYMQVFVERHIARLLSNANSLANRCKRTLVQSEDISLALSLKPLF